MKVTIIIPTYQGGHFLEECILSVLGQDYQDIELLIYDAASNDNSVDILQKYDDRIQYWVSEKDKGQSDAINKGYQRATGEVINWLCCDDRLLSGAISKVVNVFREHASLKLVSGTTQVIHKKNIDVDASLYKPIPSKIALMPCANPFPQPSTFIRRKDLEKRGFYVRDDLHYCMDFELWNYLLTPHKESEYFIIDDILSQAIISGDNKTSLEGKKILMEADLIYGEYHRPREKVPLSHAYMMTRMYLDAKYSQENCSQYYRKATYPLWRLISSLLNRIYGKDRVYLISHEWRVFYKKMLENGEFFFK